MPAVSAFVTRAAEEAGLDDQAVYGLRLAVDEIATNAILHGYRKAARSGELLLEALLEAHTLCIILRDTSPRYDPRGTPPPEDLERAPEERGPGGWGVYLALQAVDAYSYTYAAGVNRHRFRMNRKQ